ncbi:MAG: hypothetical protein Q8M34_03845 [Thermodesulfovibrionales bacterium]|nr:hypothetical protein [Thermodesulfovibrionales bacterium]
MKIFRFALLFLLLACITISAEAQTNSYRHPATGLIFPDSVAGIVRGDVTDFEGKNPGLGVSVAYDRPGITVTLYIYTFGFKSIPSDLSSPALRTHFAQVMQDIYEVEKRGYYKFVNKTAEGITFLRTDKTGPQALFASFSYVQNGIERLSRVYLLGHKQHFVKIRFTYDKSVQAQTEGKLTAFLNEMADMIERNL